MGFCAVGYSCGWCGLPEFVFGRVRDSTGRLAFRFERPLMGLRPGSVLCRDCTTRCVGWLGWLGWTETVYAMTYTACVSDVFGGLGRFGKCVGSPFRELLTWHKLMVKVMVIA
jgi:hypothetical protein